MRIMILFDLPVLTAKDRKEYNYFHKNLIKEGFIMLQESVYTKLILNPTAADSVRERIKKIKPAHGLVQMLTVTEKQFASMETVVGKYQTTVVNTTERMVIV